MSSKNAKMNEQKMPEYKEKEAENRKKKREITKEKNRLLALLSDLSKENINAADGLLDECAFMRVTLSQLRKHIDENGFVDEMDQGNYKITRESPAVRTYNTMVQKYSAVCKQLFDMLPEKSNKLDKEDGFDKFYGNK